MSMSTPFAHELLSVGDGHALYVEQHGRRNGSPALFLHGGPGGGCGPHVPAFFDLAHCRLVLVDQRGSGRSVPNVADDYRAGLHENHTPKLVADLERLREHLGVATWAVVLGGSWGTTLALSYAQAHPDRVDSLVLRGVFTLEPDEIDGLFRNGRTAGHYPVEWRDYLAFARAHRPDLRDPLMAYQSMLDDPRLRLAAAQAFVRYELSMSKVHLDADALARQLATPSFVIPFAACEVAYLLAGGYLPESLLAPHRLRALAGIDVQIVHGRSDHVCLPLAAWRLAEALEAVGQPCRLQLVAGAGHADSEPGIAAALREATDRVLIPRRFHDR